jgi:cytochrome c peroxidase
LKNALLRLCVLGRRGVALGGALLLAAAGGGDDAPAELVLRPFEVEALLEHGALGPPPPDPTNRVADDPRAARLGQWLFFDPALSRNGEVSCATCHLPGKAFVDGRPSSKGVGLGVRNAPTVLDVAWNRWYFWDGRADSAWGQVCGPLENRIEMDGDRVAIARRVHDHPELRRAYEDVFGPLPEGLGTDAWPRHARPLPAEPEHPHHVAWLALEPGRRDAVTGVFVNLAKSIAAYERRLATGPAPFDRFAEALRTGSTEGRDALSPAAQRGFQVFAGRGQCTTCHFGPAFTDGEFHDVGTPALGGAHHGDPGRYEGLGRLAGSEFLASGRWSDAPEGERAAMSRAVKRGPETWGQVKTPSLRGVARTAPYMHRGQFADIEAVVRFYATRDGARGGADHHSGETILLPFGLSDRGVADVIAFLESLSGTDPAPGLLEQPATPLLPDSP